MKKNKRNLLLCAFFIILAIAFTIVVKFVDVQPTGASNTDIITPLLDVISVVTPTLTITGNQAKAVTSVYTRKNCKISLSMKLQKKSGSEWKTVKTWSTSNENTTILRLSQTYSIDAGSYRVYSVVIADGEKVEETSPVRTR